MKNNSGPPSLSWQTEKTCLILLPQKYPNDIIEKICWKRKKKVVLKTEKVPSADQKQKFQEDRKQMGSNK